MRQILKILFLFSTTIFVNQYKNHTNILINIKIVGHTRLLKKKKKRKNNQNYFFIALNTFKIGAEEIFSKFDCLYFCL